LLLIHAIFRKINEENSKKTTEDAERQQADAYYPYDEDAADAAAGGVSQEI
jgi:hypothetical protein